MGARHRLAGSPNHESHSVAIVAHRARHWRASFPFLVPTLYVGTHHRPFPRPPLLLSFSLPVFSCIALPPALRYSPTGASRRVPRRDPLPPRLLRARDAARRGHAHATHRPAPSHRATSALGWMAQSVTLPRHPIRSWHWSRNWRQDNAMCLHWQTFAPISAQFAFKANSYNRLGLSGTVAEAAF